MAHCKLILLSPLFPLIILSPVKEAVYAVYAVAVVDHIGVAISQSLARLMEPTAEVVTRESLYRY